MQKTKTIYVNARFVTQPLTGVQRYAFECCMQMKKTNPELVFLSPKNIRQKQWATELEITTIGLNKGHVWEQLDLPFYFMHKKNYVLFNPCNTAPLFLNTNFITVHDISYHIYPKNNSTLFRIWYNYLMPRILKKATHVFTVSETVKKQIANLYSLPSKKITVTYNGIADCFTIEGKKTIQKEKIILAVGSLSKRKNLEILLTAFISSSLFDEYTLIIIGSEEAAFSKIVLPANEHILFEKNVDDKNLIDYYHRAEIFVSLSLYEGFGIPVLEALYANCKVLCADIPTYHELFEEYVYFCDQFNKADIQLKLTQISINEYEKSIDLKPLKEKYSFSKSAVHILSHLEDHIEL